MKYTCFSILVTATACLLGACDSPNEESTIITGGPGPETRTETFDPFAGGDLTDWAMDPALWTVREGVIIGSTSEDQPLEHNKFLIWQGGELSDFELSCEVKLTGDNNSGIQYRSEVREDLGEFVVSGYQCDIHPNPDYLGMCYEEKGRGIIATRGQKVVITPEGKKLLVGQAGEPAKVDVSDWNTYTIRAQGNRVIHEVNGIVTVEFIDLQEEARSLSGVLAFQVHRGPEMEVRIRNIEITPLPEGDILTADDVEIPADAEEVHAPRKKSKN